MISQVGFTTSGCHSPALGSGLAMASVPVQLSTPGTRLQVSVSHWIHVESLTLVLQVMLAGEPRQAEVLDGPPVLTQPVRERRNME